jgi:hypothetical protein
MMRFFKRSAIKKILHPLASLEGMNESPKGFRNASDFTTS